MCLGCYQQKIGVPLDAKALDLRPTHLCSLAQCVAHHSRLHLRCLQQRKRMTRGATGQGEQQRSSQRHAVP